MNRVFVIVLLFVLGLTANAKVAKDPFKGVPTNVAVVALTLLAEARGEGQDGMYAVACVIQIRQAERKLTPSRVCLQFKQFSCWNGQTRSVVQKKVLGDTSPKTIAYAIKIANQVVKGVKLDHKVVAYANHYCTLETFPNWAVGESPVVIKKNHKFFLIKS